MSKKNRNIIRSLMMVSQIGISMMVPIFLCLWLGKWLDSVFHTQFLILVFLFIGIGSAFRNIYMMTASFYSEDMKKEHARMKYIQDLKDYSKNHPEEQNTDVSNRSDEPEEKTDVSDQSDEPEEKTDVSNQSDEPEEKMDVSNQSDEPEEKTDVSDQSDEPEEKTDVSDQSDELEGKMDVSDRSDEPEEKNLKGKSGHLKNGEKE